ncbi:hypothetical protein PHYPSEUDO_000490 [Phytophthora pseudosyringae]|uniref:Uncharacterized protein n=1 Tax=Phytophthora pseudosyringae TaxID=221518 RepID=A0A8T1VZA9_9STRA|nr:hypothetical protein PHYPSEUDO_000490 [Phytophthora pseudosyringae]
MPSKTPTLRTGNLTQKEKGLLVQHIRESKLTQNQLREWCRVHFQLPPGPSYPFAGMAQVAEEESLPLSGEDAVHYDYSDDTIAEFCCVTTSCVDLDYNTGQEEDPPVEVPTDRQFAEALNLIMRYFAVKEIDNDGMAPIRHSSSGLRVKSIASRNDHAPA